ncbi:MAG: O-linked GlcNAc transferase [Reichenbachiella sp.]|uniref:O-linked GlcNAc transferase n=1 Tax=Reichenbachiella sp. TaxID=2184521 RepID=UPI003267A861
MTMQILEQYMLEADRAFEQQLYLEGKRYLEDALAEEPTYGKAHNHMGWLYLYHLDESEKAELHLKLALKYAANYSAPYIHMSHLLFETGRFEELQILLDTAADVPGVPQSFLANEFGRLNEIQGRYTAAIKCYKEAVKWSLNEQEIAIVKDNINRCKNKRWFFLF